MIPVAFHLKREPIVHCQWSILEEVSGLLWIRVGNSPLEVCSDDQQTRIIQMMDAVSGFDLGLPDSSDAEGVHLDRVGEELFYNVCGTDMSPDGFSVLGARQLITRSLVGQDGHPVRGTGQSARLTLGPEGNPLLVSIEDDAPIADQLLGATVQPLELPDEFDAASQLWNTRYRAIPSGALLMEKASQN